MNIISIGYRCRIASYLRKKNLRKESNLFDWDFTLSLETINEILNHDNLKNIYFEFNNLSNKLIDYNFGTGKGKKNLMLENKHIKGLIFRHFDLNDKIEKDKYLRRIDRLHETLNDNKKIIFIRDLHYGNVYSRLQKCNINLRYNLDDNDNLINNITTFFNILKNKYHRENDLLILITNKNINFKNVICLSSTNLLENYLNNIS